MNNKTILLTGAAGFIGANLVQELMKTVDSIHIIGLDNMNDYYDVSIKEYRLKQSGLYDYFQGMFVSDEIGYPKPQKEFFDYCIDHLSCQRDEIMIIGDSLEADIVGGINAGIKTCWVNLKNKKTVHTNPC